MEQNMNIETANRLIEYRKKNNLSQDQVAEKIGVSRQAVSKWERAEASPDTDNLIMLSKIYNVSLDELINGKRFEAADTAADDNTAQNGGDSNSGNSDGNTADINDSDSGENAPKALHYTSDDGKRIDVEFDENGINIKHTKNADNANGECDYCGENSGDNSKSSDSADNADEPKDHISFKNGIHIDSKDGNKVHIGPGGVHVHDKNGDKVDVGWNGIHVSEGRANGDEVHIDKNGVFVEENGKTRVTTDENGNIIVDDEVKRAHNSKMHRFFNHFPYYALCIIAYILFGFFNVCGGWAFGWMIFLTIPLYYTLVSAIFKRRPSDFAYPVLTLLIFLYTGFYHSLWHPMWVIFLTIPIYYMVCDFIKKMND